MGVDDEDNDESKKVQWGSTPKSKKCANWVKLRKCGAHLGLFLALVIYTAIGAYIFQVLEEENEKDDLNERKEKLQLARENFTFSILSITNDTSMTTTVMDFLNVYENIIINVSDGYMEQFMDDSSDIQPSWTYIRSAFFASTVITTIGYGDMAPDTFYGRLWCIIFAFFGIPLTLTVIADIGKMMASIISHSYKKWKKHFPKNENLSTSKFKKWVTVVGGVGFLFFYIGAGGAIFNYWEEWGFFNAFYFCFITMTTIGLGDLVPGGLAPDKSEMLFCTIYILIGLALTSTAIELARIQYADSWRKMRELSARLQGLSGLADSLRKYGDNINLDVSVLHDLKELTKALSQAQSSGKTKREGSIWKKFWENEDGFEPTESSEPRLIQIIIYESSV